MSERRDRMNFVETDDIIVVVVVAGLILIGAFFLIGDQHTGSTLGNSHLAKVEAPATE